jgi:peptidoglycan/xylan/chitin deacetylase (PgdA/CDA1 family)
MFKRLEIIIGACLYYSGLVRLARFRAQRSGQKLVILCYHRASGGNLRSQLLYLKRHYRILHLESALEELYRQSEGENQKRDRRTLLVVAFDDGYSDNYTDGFAITRELQIPITIFLVPTYIEGGCAFSWLAGEDNHLIPYAQVNEVTIDGNTYLLSNVDEREKLEQAVNDRLRYPSSVAGREAYLASVRRELGVPSFLTEKEKADFPLTWPEVQIMEKSGLVSFGAHTMHHPMLTCLTDPLEVDYEVGECRSVLEKKLGHPVRTFAYPYGEFGERELRAARAAQYAWAVTTIHGFNTSQTDPHQLYRIVVGVHQHWWVVAAKASGMWEFFLRPCSALLNFVKKERSRKGN